MPVSFYNSFCFFPPFLYRILSGKMEFDHIRSSAALIYDEFFQNAGEFWCLIKFWNVCLFSDVDVAPLCAFFGRLSDRELVPYAISNPTNDHHCNIHLLCHIAWTSNNGEPQTFGPERSPCPLQLRCSSPLSLHDL